MFYLCFAEPFIQKICGELHPNAQKAFLIRNWSGHSNSTLEGNKWGLGSRLPGKKTTWQHSQPLDFILETVRPFISNTDTILHTSRLRSDPVCVFKLCNSQQTIDLHTVQGWFLSTAASLARLPEDMYNGHFLFNAGCWFHSVWSPLVLKVWVDMRRNVSSNRW